MARTAGRLTSTPTAGKSNEARSIVTEVRDNCRRMRFTLIEFSGGLGDLGLFIPLTLALSLTSGMDIGVILVFAGLFNIVTGVLFGLPIPVQPMKAIAVVAIAEQLLPHEIAAAGVTVGAVIFLLGSTGLIETVNRWIPQALIRGIQLGIGLKLAVKGLQLIGDTSMWGIDSVALALLLGTVIILLRNSRKAPSALLLVTCGVIAAFMSAPSSMRELTVSFPAFSFIIPSDSDWITGLVRGGLPQLPLTLLNSVLAVCALSGDLFPDQRVSTRKMATSVGMMNLVSVWFGGMPMCHGSGGLAGQYHFGARTGGSVVMLGAGKLSLGLLFGSFVMGLLPYFPQSILGLLLLFSGVELTLPARDQIGGNGFYIAAVTAAGILAVNTLVGFLIGAAVALLLHRRATAV